MSGVGGKGYVVDLVTPYGREEQVEFVEWMGKKPFPIAVNTAYFFMKQAVERGSYLSRGPGYHFMFWMDTQADADAFAQRWGKYARVCLREPYHEGPCNGLPKDTCWQHHPA